jgi:hypothetical protein
MIDPNAMDAITRVVGDEKSKDLSTEKASAWRWCFGW